MSFSLDRKATLTSTSENVEATNVKRRTTQNGRWDADAALPEVFTPPHRYILNTTVTSSGQGTVSNDDPNL